MINTCTLCCINFAVDDDKFVKSEAKVGSKVRFTLNIIMNTVTNLALCISLVTSSDSCIIVINAQFLPSVLYV